MHSDIPPSPSTQNQSQSANLSSDAEILVDYTHKGNEIVNPRRTNSWVITQKKDKKIPLIVSDPLISGGFNQVRKVYQSIDDTEPTWIVKNPREKSSENLLLMINELYAWKKVYSHLQAELFIVNRQGKMRPVNLASIESPHKPNISHYTLPEDVDAPYGRIDFDYRFVTHYLGITLDNFLFPRNFQNSYEINEFFINLIKDLDNIHKVHGLVHRDITLSNILIPSKTKQPVFIDWGLSCKIGESFKLTKICNKYAPPEINNIEPEYLQPSSEHTDVYLLSKNILQPYLVDKNYSCPILSDISKTIIGLGWARNPDERAKLSDLIHTLDADSLIFKELSKYLSYEICCHIFSEKSVNLYLSIRKLFEEKKVLPRNHQQEIERNDQQILSHKKSVKKVNKIIRIAIGNQHIRLKNLNAFDSNQLLTYYKSRRKLKTKLHRCMIEANGDNSIDAIKAIYKIEANIPQKYKIIEANIRQNITLMLCQHRNPLTAMDEFRHVILRDIEKPVNWYTLDTFIRKQVKIIRKLQEYREQLLLEEPVTYNFLSDRDLATIILSKIKKSLADAKRIIQDDFFNNSRLQILDEIISWIDHRTKLSVEEIGMLTRLCDVFLSNKPWWRLIDHAYKGDSERNYQGFEQDAQFIYKFYQEINKEIPQPNLMPDLYQSKNIKQEINKYFFHNQQPQPTGQQLARDDKAGSKVNSPTASKLRSN